MKRTQQKPTPEQLDLMPGDRVTVTLDDGTTAFDVVTDEPSKLGGHMWVAWLDDHGSYLLNRVQPIATLATSGADDDDGDGGRQDLGGDQHGE